MVRTAAFHAANGSSILPGATGFRPAGHEPRYMADFPGAPNSTGQSPALLKRLSGFESQGAHAATQGFMSVACANMCSYGTRRSKHCCLAGVQEARAHRVSPVCGARWTARVPMQAMHRRSGHPAAPQGPRPARFRIRRSLCGLRIRPVRPQPPLPPRRSLPEVLLHGHGTRQGLGRLSSRSVEVRVGLRQLPR